MSADSKKNQQKGNPKEQRRKRQGRQPVERKTENVLKEAETHKVPVKTEQEKPVYEPPGPEFYKNLKRETDEILKITEEANSKYKKKEIQSNWAKYEMPIESYEEIEEQENMGADYASLIQAPLSIGGHFQFKHEKSWDISTGPSLYDKYFDINMDELATALSTIPFYERNNIDLDIFNETDILSMNHRATKYKQKYFNDKKYSTPELEAQDKILSSLRKSEENEHDNKHSVECDDFKFEVPEEVNNQSSAEDIILEAPTSESVVVEVENSRIESNIQNASPVKDELEKELVDSNEQSKITHKNETMENAIVINSDENISEDIKENKEQTRIESEIDLRTTVTQIETDKPAREAPTDAMFQSPEDLEKWLDDFLEG